jgi:hypothetical protein
MGRGQTSGSIGNSFLPLSSSLLERQNSIADHVYGYAMRQHLLASRVITEAGDNGNAKTMA